MTIEAFHEIFNIVCICKKLHDMGKHELAVMSFDDILMYDTYYEGMHMMIDNLFDHSHCQYYDSKNLELHVLSDPVIVDFYILAGEYGRCHNIPDDANPFISRAKQQVQEQLNFSYCLDWMLMGHTAPKRPYHSRLGLLISLDGEVEIGCLAYRLLVIYDWFHEQGALLQKLLLEATSKQPNPVEWRRAA